MLKNCRCDICDVDLPSKEISDVHFASEDHETAQVLHPLADAVQDTIDDSLMITPAVSHHRYFQKMSFYDNL